jgi:transposase
MGKSKYSLAFKLKIVKKIANESMSIDSLSHKTGIDRSIIRKWFKFYELYGIKGLERPTNRVYSLDFKVSVLETIQKEGLSLKETARRFNISAESSIRNWQTAYEKNGILGLENKPRGRPKEMNIKRKKRKPDKPLTREEELLQEIECLKAENALLKKLDALILARKKPKS